MLASMSAKGDRYDHAVAESFFSTLEFALLMNTDWHTRDDARRAASCTCGRPRSRSAEWVVRVGCPRAGEVTGYSPCGTLRHQDQLIRTAMFADEGFDFYQQPRREHQLRVAFFSGERSRKRGTRIARTPA